MSSAVANDDDVAMGVGTPYSKATAIEVQKEVQHLTQLPPILTRMGMHLSHQPPTVVSMSTQASVVGVRVTDHP